MPWQKWFLVHALELHPTEVDDHGAPTFRFRKVILLVGRQNGKSTVMQVLTLWRMYVDRCALVIGTAQDLEVAESLWGESVEMAQEVEELASDIGKVERQPGRKMFRLKTGETYKVKAATRRGGRGLSGELVLLDELREHQSWDAWGAVTKTTNAKSRAQIYGISNAGDASSIVLRYLRKKAHAALGDPDGINADDDPESLIPDEGLPGDLTEDDEDEALSDTGLAIFEWSAPPGCGVMDREGWAMANPALGHRVREATLAGDAQTDPEWIFRTECLCQWSDGAIEGPFPPGSWEAGTDEESTPASDAETVACVEVSHDRSRACVTIATTRADGVPHIEVVASRPGTDWVRGWFTEAGKAHRASWRVAARSRGAPVVSLLPDLREVCAEVVEWTGSEVPAACGSLYDAVRGLGEDGVNTPRVFHRPQPRLDLPAATASTRPTSDGWMWDMGKSPTDIAPLVGVTGALWLLNRPDEKIESAYESHGVLTI